LDHLPIVLRQCLDGSLDLNTQAIEVDHLLRAQSRIQQLVKVVIEKIIVVHQPAHALALIARGLIE
jgi:hypothetical protein